MVQIKPFGALASDQAKLEMLKTKGCDTIRTDVLDYARGFNWPKPYTARVKNNDFIQQWHGKSPLSKLINSEQQQRYFDACLQGNFNIAGLFVGKGIDIIDEILSVNVLMGQLSQAW